MKPKNVNSQLSKPILNSYYEQLKTLIKNMENFSDFKQIHYVLGVGKNGKLLAEFVSDISNLKIINRDELGLFEKRKVIVIGEFDEDIQKYRKYGYRNAALYRN